MEIVGISATPSHIQSDNNIAQKKTSEQNSEPDLNTQPSQTVEANRDLSAEVGNQIDVTA